MSDIRRVWTENRLTVIGRKDDVALFNCSNWKRKLRARFCEQMLRLKGRSIWEFKTETPPIEFLKKLSAHWPGLVLLLDYESMRERIKGLAKARAGELEHYKISY